MQVDTIADALLAQRVVRRKQSQAEAGLELGVCAHTVSMWERGRFRPNVEALLPLAEYLELDVAAVVRLVTASA